MPSPASARCRQGHVPQSLAACRCPLSRGGHRPNRHLRPARVRASAIEAVAGRPRRRPAAHCTTVAGNASRRPWSPSSRSSPPRAGSTSLSNISNLDISQAVGRLTAWFRFCSFRVPLGRAKSSSDSGRLPGASYSSHAASRQKKWNPALNHARPRIDCPAAWRAR